MIDVSRFEVDLNSGDGDKMHNFAPTFTEYRLKCRGRYTCRVLKVTHFNSVILENDEFDSLQTPAHSGAGYNDKIWFCYEKTKNDSRVSVKHHAQFCPRFCGEFDLDPML